MKTLFKILCSATILLSASFSSAFMFEPFVGYQMGDYKIDSIKDDISGLELGARLGYKMPMVGVGFEYSMTQMKREESDGNRDFESTDMGAFLAVHFPILIQVYFTYFFKSEAEEEKIKGDYEGSGGYRIGVGYTGLPFVSINLELIKRTYDEFNNENLSSDLNVNTTMLSVSLPLP